MRQPSDLSTTKGGAMPTTSTRKESGTEEFPSQFVIQYKLSEKTYLKCKKLGADFPLDCLEKL